MPGYISIQKNLLLAVVLHTLPYRKPAVGNCSAYIGIQKNCYGNLFCIHWYTENLLWEFVPHTLPYRIPATGNRFVYDGFRMRSKKERKERIIGLQRSIYCYGLFQIFCGLRASVSLHFEKSCRNIFGSLI